MTNHDRPTSPSMPSKSSWMVTSEAIRTWTAARSRRHLQLPLSSGLSEVDRSHALTTGRTPGLPSAMPPLYWQSRRRRTDARLRRPPSL